MKKIRIAHLYYDLMNLYGENGNVRFLKKKLEEQSFDVEVHFLTIGDDIDFNNYDFFYIGMGSDENKYVVLEDMLRYKNDIKKAIENKKYFLITGNAIELFGEGIINLNNEFTPTLEVFKYQVKEEEFRIVGEQYYDTDIVDKKIIGFQNRNSVIINCKENNLFKVIKGTGLKPDDLVEGIFNNNFYGTYLLGPILVRNPYFTDYIINQVCLDMNCKYNKVNDNMAYKAYNEYLKNFYGDE